jgi:hypothetical protein
MLALQSALYLSCELAIPSPGNRNLRARKTLPESLARLFGVTREAVNAASPCGVLVTATRMRLAIHTSGCDTRRAGDDQHVSGCPRECAQIRLAALRTAAELSGAGSRPSCRSIHKLAMGRTGAQVPASPDQRCVVGTPPDQSGTPVPKRCAAPLFADIPCPGCVGWSDSCKGSAT